MWGWSWTWKQRGGKVRKEKAPIKGGCAVHYRWGRLHSVLLGTLGETRGMCFQIVPVKDGRQAHLSTPFCPESYLQDLTSLQPLAWHSQGYRERPGLRRRLREESCDTLWDTVTHTAVVHQGQGHYHCRSRGLGIACTGQDWVGGDEGESWL